VAGVFSRGGSQYRIHIHTRLAAFLVDLVTWPVLYIALVQVQVDNRNYHLALFHTPVTIIGNLVEGQRDVDEDDDVDDVPPRDGDGLLVWRQEPQEIDAREIRDEYRTTRIEAFRERGKELSTLVDAYHADEK